MCLGLALAACTEPEVPDAVIAEYYAEVQRDLLAEGRLRQDRNPADAPVTLSQLVANFEEVALYSELSLEDDRFVERRSASYLGRWGGPISYGVVFGDSVPPEVARQDLADLRDAARRISRATGIPIRYRKGGDVDLMVFYLDRAEQREFGRFLASRENASPALADSFLNSPVYAFCAFFTSEGEARGTISSAMILIKAEHPKLTRKSCVDEEFAQAMGLPNDSPKARPSVFNDDEEFALLTKHDEALLAMLYDRRLKPGQRPEELRALLPKVARAAARRVGLRLAPKAGS